MKEDEELFKRLQKNEVRCAKCNLIIPFVYMRGDNYTCPSFTFVDDKPICYYCYHPPEYGTSNKKKK